MRERGGGGEGGAEYAASNVIKLESNVETSREKFRGEWWRFNVTNLQA